MGAAVYRTANAIDDYWDAYVVEVVGNVVQLCVGLGMLAYATQVLGVNVAPSVLFVNDSGRKYVAACAMACILYDSMLNRNRRMINSVLFIRLVPMFCIEDLRHHPTWMHKLSDLLFASSLCLVSCAAWLLS